MFQLLLFFLGFTAPAQAANLDLCATFDQYNKYFVVDSVGKGARQRVLNLCVATKRDRARCQQNLSCHVLTNRKPTRLQKITPFPPALRGPKAPGYRQPPRPSYPSEPSFPSPAPSPPPRDKNAGGSCRENRDCFSNQFCAGGQCFEKSGGGSQSCKANRDCFSSDFCVSGQCFPKTGSQGGSCKENRDCFSSQFCVSGECFEK